MNLLNNIIMGITARRENAQLRQRIQDLEITIYNLRYDAHGIQQTLSHALQTIDEKNEQIKLLTSELQKKK